MFGEYKTSPTALKMLALGSVIFMSGTSFLWPLTTTYIHEIQGKSLTMAGLLLLFNQASALIGNLMGGHLFDRWGGFKTMVLGVFLSMIIVAGIGIFPGFLFYAVCLTLLGFCNGMILPALMALAANVWPAGGRKAVNLIYVAQNLGVAIGSALGGFIASYSFQWAFLGNSITYAIFLFLLFVVKSKLTSISMEARQGLAAKPSTGDSLAFSKSIYLSIGMLSLALIACWIPYVQWSTTVPIYLQGMGIPISAYSLLWTLNGALIVLGQPFINWFIPRFTPTLKQQAIVGSLIYTLTFLMISFVGSFWQFVLAMVIMTIGEMIVSPAVPALTAEISPEESKGQFQGIIAGAVTFGRMIGPLFGGWLFEWANARWTYLVMMVLCLLAAFFYSQYDRFLLEDKQSSPQTG